jgi:nucleotide-binding universal stress UspA family protein
MATGAAGDQEGVMNRSRINGHFRRILVGYDGSPPSEKALEIGLSIASTLDSKLEVLAVVPQDEPSATAEPHASVDDPRKRYEKALRRIADAANENGIEIETDTVAGHPAEQIIQRARQSHADLIVVGRRGSSKFKNLVMGSVSEHVMAHAQCPVLVTR